MICIYIYIYIYIYKCWIYLHKVFLFKRNILFARIKFPLSFKILLILIYMRIYHVFILLLRVEVEQNLTVVFIVFKTTNFMIAFSSKMHFPSTKFLIN